jgi:hypothetical protein
MPFHPGPTNTGELTENQTLQAGRLDQVWRGDRLDPAPSPWTLPYTDDIVPNWSGEAFEDRWKLTLLRRGSGDLRSKMVAIEKRKLPA